MVIIFLSSMATTINFNASNNSNTLQTNYSNSRKQNSSLNDVNPHSKIASSSSTVQGGNNFSTATIINLGYTNGAFNSTDGKFQYFKINLNGSSDMLFNANTSTSYMFDIFDPSQVIVNSTMGLPTDSLQIKTATSGYYYVALNRTDTSINDNFTIYIANLYYTPGTSFHSAIKILPGNYSGNFINSYAYLYFNISIQANYDLIFKAEGNYSADIFNSSKSLLIQNYQPNPQINISIFNSDYFYIELQQPHDANWTYNFSVNTQTTGSILYINGASSISSSIRIPLATIQNELSPPTTSTYYKIYLNSSNMYVFNFDLLSSSGTNNYFTLYNSSLNSLGLINPSYNSTSSFSLTIRNSSFYYFGVFCSYFCEYKIKINSTSNIFYGGNTFSSALEISPGNYSGYLTNNEVNEYFKILVNQSYNIFINTFGEVTGLYLYNSSNYQLMSNTSFKPSIRLSITATGYYFIKIIHSQANWGQYNLSVVTPLTGTDYYYSTVYVEGSNSIQTAVSISTGHYSSYIVLGQYVYIFKIYLINGYNLHIKTDSKITITLFNSTYQEIASIYYLDSLNLTILNSAIYYITIGNVSNAILLFNFSIGLTIPYSNYYTNGGGSLSNPIIIPQKTDKIWVNQVSTGSSDFQLELIGGFSYTISISHYNHSTEYFNMFELYSNKTSFYYGTDITNYARIFRPEKNATYYFSIYDFFTNIHGYIITIENNGMMPQSTTNINVKYNSSTDKITITWKDSKDPGLRYLIYYSYYIIVNDINLDSLYLLGNVSSGVQKLVILNPDINGAVYFTVTGVTPNGVYSLIEPSKSITSSSIIIGTIATNPINKPVTIISYSATKSSTNQNLSTPFLSPSDLVLTVLLIVIFAIIIAGVYIFKPQSKDKVFYKSDSEKLKYSDHSKQNQFENEIIKPMGNIELVSTYNSSLLFTDSCLNCGNKITSELELCPSCHIQLKTSDFENEKEDSIQSNQPTFSKAEKNNMTSDFTTNSQNPTITCHNCGTINFSDSVFCQNCGNSLVHKTNENFSQSNINHSFGINNNSEKTFKDQNSKSDSFSFSNPANSVKHDNIHDFVMKNNPFTNILINKIWFFILFCGFLFLFMILYGIFISGTFGNTVFIPMIILASIVAGYLVNILTVDEIVKVITLKSAPEVNSYINSQILKKNLKIVSNTRYELKVAHGIVNNLITTNTIMGIPVFKTTKKDIHHVIITISYMNKKVTIKGRRKLIKAYFSDLLNEN